MQDVTSCWSTGVFAGVDLEQLALREGTPLYVYSAPAIRSRMRALQDALQGLNAGIRYAVKANGTLAVLQLLAEQGAGAHVAADLADDRRR